MKDQIRLFNTLNRDYEIFTPLKNKEVMIYHCGPTVYWTQHIGNMRAAFFGDIIHRTLLYAGYKVIFVRNYTDVGHLSGDNEGDADTGEDRMQKAARREASTPEAIARKYQQMFDADLEALNILTPDHRPHATEYIQAMIAMIEELIAKSYAYQTELAIYFDTTKLSDYYKLSGQTKEKLTSGAGTGEVRDSDKHNPADFALWFFKKGVHSKALQTWLNPFSDVEGFPGWHIECSAMIKEILGTTIDIHLGGIEHIPIHHTNEIAQSESLNNAPLAHYWLHNEHLDVDGAKMSKSDGTSYSLADVISKGYSPLDLRYFFLQAHYRSKQNFTWEALKAAQTARTRLNTQMKALPQNGKVNIDWKSRFKEALFNDFNTAQALGVVNEMLKSDIDGADKRATILSFDTVLGLELDMIKEGTMEVPNEIQTLFDLRKQARDAQNWEKSDSLRDEMLSLGYEVHDTPQGQRISKKI
ncbi:MAG: cysteine--tRNA ligase [Patescibacteria group bacterium]